MSGSLIGGKPTLSTFVLSPACHPSCLSSLLPVTPLSQQPLPQSSGPHHSPYSSNRLSSKHSFLITSYPTSAVPTYPNHPHPYPLTTYLARASIVLFRDISSTKVQLLMENTPMNELNGMLETMVLSPISLVELWAQHLDKFKQGEF